jgi:hypothetical protein
MVWQEGTTFHLSQKAAETCTKCPGMTFSRAVKAGKEMLGFSL